MCPKIQPRRRGLRIAVWLLVPVLVVAAGLVGVVLWQNSYDMDEQRVSIRHGGHTLNGVLATPKDGRKRHGLIVYVHGDGPIGATHDDGYKPMWEANAKAGYASLSWDKPGVAGAPGNWLDQSMDDRADEAATAIAWARARPDIDGDRIGLWGASQAGWVLPKVAAKTPVSFVIAVSPAINWLQQGRYNLLAELRADGASAARTEAEIAKSDTTRRLLGRHATFSWARYIREPCLARWSAVEERRARQRLRARLGLLRGLLHARGEDAALADTVDVPPARHRRDSLWKA
ncbi:alpha/beta hydrolase family protein [Streptomyces purpureus]|uniref:Xaa-Pro dipeptidyl-peptidase-like domain-containing protein n=1 Tax=Streptomyces purpureus TaxID=1951 RepID=A0A918GWE4_9ACTN|nr:CocE/NonD family hydrolase [Streptomyces purpureus]GGT14976.1 hypothetical protein GCM10014713_04660 [Streptomyces purpureus]